MLKMTRELEQAVVAQQGGPLRIAGEERSYVVMSDDRYRELSGVADDADLDASVAALQRAMADVRAGRTRPASEFLDELSHKYAVPS
ncbi:MAG: hypothetical protein IAG10_27415 [Planctomycetaceae bacterium]|nr:hypothetical protein [Planctomycetaceae bacterium]